MAQIIVIGSVARDEVVNLAEPLVPGAHLNGTLAGARLGGGGANTAIALAAAGHEVTLLTAVGRDEAGDALLTELEAAGVITTHIARLQSPTTQSFVFVDPLAERTIVNVARCDEPGPPTALLDLPADAVYVRSRRLDLAPLLTAKATTALVVAHVPPVAAGARPAHILVASASDLGTAELDNPLTMGRKVAGEDLEWIVVTDGARGAQAISVNGTLNAAAQEVKTVDTTGAGDAFAAGLVHGMVSGHDMQEALAIAVRFGTEATLWPTSALPGKAVRRLIT